MLTNPLMEEAGQILSEHLPIMDVAQILASEFGITSDAPLAYAYENTYAQFNAFDWSP